MRKKRKNIDLFPTDSFKRKNAITILTKKYGFRCWYCGYRFEHSSEVCLDHIKPLSQSKNSDLENLALSCKFCNSIKFIGSVEEFLRYLSRIRTGQFECLILEEYKDKIDNTTMDILSKYFF